MRETRMCPSCGGILGQDCFNPGECAEITRSMAQNAPLPEIGPASVELLARVMCKADGDDPDRYWQDYKVQADAAAEWFRDFMANS